MKAVKERKLPNLRRIELNRCTMSDCEWPEVPEFFYELKTLTVSDPSQIQKLLLKLTELTVREYKEKPLHLDRLIHVPLEKLSVLKVKFRYTAGLQNLNNVLEQRTLPNLSKLVIDLIFADIHRYSVLRDSGKIDRKICQLESFLDEFEPHQTAKLEKLALQWFTISAEELEILCDKLTSVRLTELDLFFSSGFRGNLSALFTHSFPRLNTLKLMGCELNSSDLQSLARANVEGKLPQLRHLDIADTDISDLYALIPQRSQLDIPGELKFEISDLFAHSSQWNQLKTLCTSDGNILNIGPDLLTSLEKLCLTWHHWDANQLPQVTRCWSGLKTIQLASEEGITCVADSVEQGMFPTLTTVKLKFNYSSVNKLSLFKLFKANIFVHTEL